MKELNTHILQKGGNHVDGDEQERNDDQNDTDNVKCGP